MTENGRLEAVTDSLVVMVDQMWLWTSARGKLNRFWPSSPYTPLPNVSPGSFLTCSPIHDSRLKQKAGTPSSTDIIASFANKSEVHGTIGIMISIIQHAITGVFGGVEAGQGDILSIYRWAIANKVRPS